MSSKREDPVKQLLPQGGSYNGYLQPSEIVQIADYQWPHEMRVWLPPSYHLTDAGFPVIWVMDNGMELMRAATRGGTLAALPEFIIVAIGAPSGTETHEAQTRRTYDFIPEREHCTLHEAFEFLRDDDVGGASQFLDLIVNHLRPRIVSDYRVDESVQVLAGHSGGAQFGLFALFSEPRAFSHYLISSPGVLGWESFESRWFETHDDLPAKVFLSAGDMEWKNPTIALARAMSSSAALAERLLLRNCKSLSLAYRVFPGEDHASVTAAAYTRGLQDLFTN